MCIVFLFACFLLNAGTNTTEIKSHRSEEEKAVSAEPCFPTRRRDFCMTRAVCQVLFSQLKHIALSLSLYVCTLISSLDLACYPDIRCLNNAVLVIAPGPQRILQFIWLLPYKLQVVFSTVPYDWWVEHFLVGMQEIGSLF